MSIITLLPTSRGSAEFYLEMNEIGFVTCLYGAFGFQITLPTLGQMRHLMQHVSHILGNFPTMMGCLSGDLWPILVLPRISLTFDSTYAEFVVP